MHDFDSKICQIQEFSDFVQNKRKIIWNVRRQIVILGKEITAGIIRDLQTLQKLDQHGQEVRLILGFDS